MYPLKLTPAFKDYLWGGNRLKTDFHKQSSLKNIAESWELSCHCDGLSVIENGEFAGMTLADFISKFGETVTGSNCNSKQFPILIKFIDAKKDLSIQVHPDNEYALANEGELGKNEMWYIIDCDKNSFIYYGFKREISNEELENRIKDNSLTEVLNKVPVKKGDVFFIEAGTVHAICSGILIAEIQQSSNTTYRIFDYGRIGIDGKPRELHIKKALDVVKKTPVSSYPSYDYIKNTYSTTHTLVSCDYFKTSEICLYGEVSFKCNEKSFNSLLIIDGNGTIKSNGNNDIDFKKGDSLFIPANLDYTIIGKCKIILTEV